jgi:uncharacterized membrane protein YqjE
MATRMATAPARIPAPPADVEHLPTLVTKLGDDVMELFDSKISLLKVELREEANTFLHSGVLIAVGAMIGWVGFALLNIAVALGVSTLFANTGLSAPAQYALGFVATGALYLVLGGSIVLAMKSRLSRQKLVPPRTVEEIRKDAQWLKKEL